MKDDDWYAGGTGAKLTRATIIVAGVAALSASLLSAISICLQLKNYRKPSLQRYVVRILLMVPIYSAASWASLLSLQAALYIDPIRDVYEAFTIYTFFQLLINFIGGERALIIMMTGRQPVSHLWPLHYFLPKVDISDPHTFLAIKRGILQYAWVKPLLGIAAIAMKATGTYQEGYVGLTSGYFWSGIIYNISITLSLYSLGLFWICMTEDLQPFRPMPKFLCIKLIIFASYWQGFFLSIFVWIGAIPSDVKGYTPDNIAAAIQAALICFEMPAFAVGHWYAFSWHDYADITISAARLPMKYALRDAFGPRDLIEDTKMTFGGEGYEYRQFDAGDNVLAHEDSDSRVARMMEGMRYERGGKGKYWIPKPGDANVRTPLLSKVVDASCEAHTMSPSDRGVIERVDTGPETEEVEPLEVDQEDERLFQNARALKFGDWNYPVITANEPSRTRWMSQDPNILTTATNRHLLQPTRANKKRREDRIRKTLDKGKRRDSSDGSKDGLKGRAPGLTSNGRPEPSTSDSSISSKSDRSQLVDLVVEDKQAEEKEQVRARKEGGAEWNENNGKHFIRTYPDVDEGEEIRQYEAPVEPSDAVDQSVPSAADDADTVNTAETDDTDDQAPMSEESREWKEAHRSARSAKGKSVSYGSMDEERSAWDNPG